MKKSIILCNFLFLNLVLLGQNDYFLFLESENNQPYYVQSDGKTLSSSSIGHLIIPRLKDSIYILTIGFPRNQFPEQVFRLRMGRKDAGYQLKNLGIEGWGLFNFQTSELIKGKVVESKKETVIYGDIKKTDVFSTLMAGLVNDSAILYTSIARVEPVKADSKSSLSDARSANTDVTKQEDIPKKDSPLSKTEIVSAQVSNNDTISKIQPVEISKNDTLIAKADLVKENDSLKESPSTTSSNVPKEDKTKTDSLLTSNESTRENDLPKKDSALAKADLAKDGDQRKDTFASKDVSQVQSPANDSKIPEPPVAPLIVQVSETKTSKGTEIIFLDQSAAGINDTITILIVKEELTSNEPGILKEDVQAKDDQKNDSGGFFGKVFGKKKKSQAPKTESESKSQPGQNTSTIKVSTVETKKTVDSPVVKSEKSKKNQQVRSKKDTTVLKADEDKNGEDGNFLSKIFRKKNKEKATKEESTTKTVSGDVASVKVTTVESSPGSNSKGESKVVVTNSDCRAFASDTDVDKLRLRMLGENDADGQVSEARKVFKQKCFSTNQVKTLSSLFRNDEGKYKLLDAAYPFVSDSRNFKELVTLLTEEYYINRFKAMVRM